MLGWLSIRSGCEFSLAFTGSLDKQYFPFATWKTSVHFNSLCPSLQQRQVEPAQQNLCSPLPNTVHVMCLLKTLSWKISGICTLCETRSSVPAAPADLGVPGRPTGKWKLQCPALMDVELLALPGSAGCKVLSGIALNYSTNWTFVTENGQKTLDPLGPPINPITWRSISWSIDGPVAQWVQWSNASVLPGCQPLWRRSLHCDHRPNSQFVCGHGPWGSNVNHPLVDVSPLGPWKSCLIPWILDLHHLCWRIANSSVVHHISIVAVPWIVDSIRNCCLDTVYTHIIPCPYPSISGYGGAPAQNPRALSHSPGAGWSRPSISWDHPTS